MEKESVDFVIVEETACRTSDQSKAFFSDEVRNELKKHNYTLYIIDKDVKNGSGNIPKKFEKVLSMADPNNLPVLFVVKGNEIVLSKPIPKNVDISFWIGFIDGVNYGLQLRGDQ